MCAVPGHQAATIIVITTKGLTDAIFTTKVSYCVVIGSVWIFVYFVNCSCLVAVSFISIFMTFPRSSHMSMKSTIIITIFTPVLNTFKTIFFMWRNEMLQCYIFPRSEIKSETFIIEHTLRFSAWPRMIMTHGFQCFMLLYFHMLDTIIFLFRRLCFHGIWFF